MSSYAETTEIDNLTLARASSEQDAAAQVEEVCSALDADGIVKLSGLLTPQQLEGMQQAFDSRLTRMRWNNADGYERTERYRLMVEDVLTLDQGFVDLALHPLVAGVLRKYIGPEFTLNEAKGWRSLPTQRDFHGWHGDQWYDQAAYDFIPREVKAAIYLTDVKSGAFNYIRGTHRQTAPREFHAQELSPEMLAKNVEMKAPAGTVILFDTSGIHRQGFPILEPRNAVFLNYHDPRIKIHNESDRSYRYHPLLLNAAFLGNLDDEDYRILGFGETSQLRPAYSRPSQFRRSHRFTERLQALTVFCQDLVARGWGKLRRAARK